MFSRRTFLHEVFFNNIRQSVPVSFLVSRLKFCTRFLLLPCVLRFPFKCYSVNALALKKIDWEEIQAKSVKWYD